jgi:hypothetical protein
VARKIRNDIKVGNLEKKLKLPPGTIRDPKTGRDKRSDARLKSIERKGGR